MTKKEFEERVGITVSDEKWDKIEFVYTWHPSISNIYGKDEIAQVYKIGGMRLIMDMIPTAKEWKKLEDERMSVANRLLEIKREMQTLQAGEEAEHA